MKLFSLQNKVAVIIGAGGHICSSLARGFADAGAKIAVCDLRLEKATTVADSINAIHPESSVAFEVDASSKESLSKLLIDVHSSMGNIDIALNGAGTNSPKPFLEITTEDWNSVFQTQLIATMYGCQVFGEHMLQNGSGSIINISSASADPGLSRAFAYSAAKAGIRNLTQNLGREWGKSGVRVNGIRPGFFPTEWNRKNFITPEREAAILGHTPMGRFGEPDELIGAAVFLASSASTFVTGSELIVDGGFSAMTI
jgi:NAD(P)-dependent dehydrogenase (short-subunit alcohol dehydrogenase family)